jgi:hypothetical protein
VSGNLADIPVNAIVVDPDLPRTLCAGTDPGVMVTSDGGATGCVGLYQVKRPSAGRGGNRRGSAHGGDHWRSNFNVVTIAVGNEDVTRFRAGGPAPYRYELAWAS